VVAPVRYFVIVILHFYFDIALGTCLDAGVQPHCVGPHCPVPWDGDGAEASLSTKFTFEDPDAETSFVEGSMADVPNQRKFRSAFAVLFGLETQQIVVSWGTHYMTCDVFIMAPKGTTETALEIMQSSIFGDELAAVFEKMELDINIVDIGDTQVVHLNQ
jgi:hypothetical protein